MNDRCLVGLMVAAAVVAPLFVSAGAAAQQWDASGSASASTSSGPSAGGGASNNPGVRLGLQGRVDALNLFGTSDALVLGGSAGDLGAFAPTATPGLRLVEGKLFVGLGLGMVGYSISECLDPRCDETRGTSNSGFGLNPLVSFDLIRDRLAALYLLGWLNLVSVGGGAVEERGMTTERDGFFIWGLNIGAGVRALLSDALAIGTEWGWGFASWSEGDRMDDTSVFAHGLFGTLVLEATVGL